MFFDYLECKTKIDIGFLVDSSGSIEKAGKGNYKKCLDFIKNAVNGSFISENFTHIGLVLFSSKVGNQFCLLVVLGIIMTVCSGEG